MTHGISPVASNPSSFTGGTKQCRASNMPLLFSSSGVTLSLVWAPGRNDAPPTCSCFCLICLQASADTFSGKVVGNSDGDTGHRSRRFQALTAHPTQGMDAPREAAGVWRCVEAQPIYACLRQERVSAVGQARSFRLNHWRRVSLTCWLPQTHESEVHLLVQQ